ncbi:MAG: cyclophilin-like fold protein [Candidatus Bathyarchaeia archaeon]
MPRKIRIRSDRIGVMEAEVLEDKNPRTAAAIWEKLPFEGVAHRWGDEVYFTIPVEVSEENPQEIVEVGDVGYWPPGRGFCIFFGPTPISRGSEIRPADPVNVFARIIGDPKVFRRVRDGDKVRVERAES